MRIDGIGMAPKDLRKKTCQEKRNTLVTHMGGDFDSQKRAKGFKTLR